MNKHVKAGLLTMACWIAFVCILFGSYLAMTGKSIDFLDPETGGLISSAFFIVWALIWFFIGKHYSEEYALLGKMFKQKTLKTLTCVLCGAVPFYIIWKEDRRYTAADWTILAILILLSVVSYCLMKKSKAESL